MMGAGKSTVGSLAARALGLPFVDLDERIASEAGLTVVEIFSVEGEAGFRRREGAAGAARSGGEGALGSTLAGRAAAYAAAAHHWVETAGRRPEEVTEEVVKLWRRDR